MFLWSASTGGSSAQRSAAALESACKEQLDGSAGCKQQKKILKF
jgi:hypothetical protein